MICTSLLSAAAHIHSKQIWHRDIRPQNIFLDRDGKELRRKRGGWKLQKLGTRIPRHPWRPMTSLGPSYFGETWDWKGRTGNPWVKTGHCLGRYVAVWRTQSQNPWCVSPMRGINIFCSNFASSWCGSVWQFWDKAQHLIVNQRFPPIKAIILWFSQYPHFQTHPTCWYSHSYRLNHHLSPFVMIKSDACSRKNRCHASNRPVLASFSRATHADAELPMGRHTGHGCYCAPEVLDSSLLDLPMVAMLLGSMNTLKSLSTSKYYIEYLT